MEDKKILEMIEEHCILKEGKKLLSCATAFEMSKELKIDVARIGRVCNQENIKLSNCQLGCFNGSK